MGTIVFLLAAGFSIYKLVAFNTRNGRETVRAFMYLRMLHSGVAVEQAQAMVDVGIEDVSPDVVRSARAFVQSKFGGRQLPLIRLAYENGMSARLSGWQRLLVSRA